MDWGWDRRPSSIWYWYEQHEAAIQDYHTQSEAETRQRSEGEHRHRSNTTPQAAPSRDLGARSGSSLPSSRERHESREMEEPQERGEPQARREVWRLMHERGRTRLPAGPVGRLAPHQLRQMGIEATDHDYSSPDWKESPYADEYTGELEPHTGPLPWALCRRPLSPPPLPTPPIGEVTTPGAAQLSSGNVQYGLRPVPPPPGGYQHPPGNQDGPARPPKRQRTSELGGSTDTTALAPANRSAGQRLRGHSLGEYPFSRIPRASMTAAMAPGDIPYRLPSRPSNPRVDLIVSRRASSTEHSDPEQSRAPVPPTEPFAQQTETPMQETEIPVQRVEEHSQQIEETSRQTEEPLQQTENPTQQVEEP